MLRCTNVDCEKFDCFVKCNKMFRNALVLKEIQKTVQNDLNTYDEESKMKIHKLKQDFQKNFNKMCMDFNNGYDEIMNEYMLKMFDK